MSINEQQTPHEALEYLQRVTEDAWNPEQFLQEPLERAGMHIWGAENQPTFQAMEIPQLSLALSAVACVYLHSKKTRYQATVVRNIGHLGWNLQGQSDDDIARRSGNVRTTIASQRSDVFKGCRAVGLSLGEVVTAVGGEILPTDPDANLQRTGKREQPSHRLTPAGRILLDEVLAGRIGEGWAGWAACQDMPDVDKMKIPKEIDDAKEKVCGHCRAKKDCLFEALVHEDTGTVRGGMTQPEREDYAAKINRIGARRTP